MIDTSEENIKHHIDNSNKVIGLKQVLKFGKQNSLKMIYLATDADFMVRDQIIALANNNQIPIHPVASKRKLGRHCGIEVSAACVGIINDQTD